MSKYIPAHCEISIHAPHEGERQLKKLVTGLTGKGISIHAPHEGERRSTAQPWDRDMQISIHAPHEGERHARFIYQKNMKEFQSTLPTRGSDTRTSSR